MKLSDLRAKLRTKEAPPQLQAVHRCQWNRELSAGEANEAGMVIERAIVNGKEVLGRTFETCGEVATHEYDGMVGGLVVKKYVCAKHINRHVGTRLIGAPGGIQMGAPKEKSK